MTTRKALQGLRVLDLSRVFAGPSAAQTLADLGADVTKIERPRVGDDTRSYGPHFSGGSDVGNRSSYFWSVNRGKKSVAIDLAAPRGADLIRRMAASCDVLIENFKVGTLARYGLDYATLSAINPRLIYCSISGFGQDGPLSANPGYDTIIQAMGGLMSITGHNDAQPGGGPMRAGLPVIDIISALYATTGILAALQHRNTSGKGQFVDISLLDTMVASLSYQAVGFLNTGELPDRIGVRNHIAHPAGNYECSDGQVMIIAGNDTQFVSLAKALGMPELASDPRFLKSIDRVRQADLLDEIVAPAFRRISVEECVALLNKANVPVGPINDIRGVMDYPQVRHRRDVVTLTHDDVGTVNVLASPIRLSETPVAYDRPAPTLGEHTRATLRDLLELDDEQIDGLANEGIVQ